MYGDQEVVLLLHCYDCTATPASTTNGNPASTASTPASTASSSSMLSEDCRD